MTRQTTATADGGTRGAGSSTTAPASWVRRWPQAVPVDTSGPLRSAVSQALAVLRPHGTAQAPVFRRPYMEPD
jgi:uncharacterized protein